MGKRVDFSSGFAPRKCARKKLEEDDRVSELPDEILVSILSLLTLKEAARTSVLSKRWINIWTFTPFLDFFDPKAIKRITRNHRDRKYINGENLKYVEMVNNVLGQHKGHRLDQFGVTFSLNQSNGSEIDKWLDFAFERNVQRIKLHLINWEIFHKTPEFCYAFHDIPRRGCWHVGFKPLKELSLAFVNVTNEDIQFFLDNCLSLEQLIVNNSKSLVNLEVSGPSLALKRLEIWYCFNLGSLILRDTKLVSLTVINSGALQLEKVPYLIDVKFGHLHCSETVHVCTDIFSWTSCCLSQLVNFTWYIDEYDTKRLKHYKFPELSKLKQLVLAVQTGDAKSIRGCASLIKAAPHLKRLVLLIRGCLIPDNAAAKLEKIFTDPWRPDFCNASSNQPRNRRIGRLVRRLRKAVPPHIEFFIV